MSDSSPDRRFRWLHGQAGYAVEAVIALGFSGTVIAAVNLADVVPDPAEPALAIFPVAVLTLWWAFYALRIRALDELGQVIATRSLALACAVTIWITTVWGLLTLIAGVPALPLIFVAPVAAGSYGLIRLAVMLRYR